MEILLQENMKVFGRPICTKRPNNLVQVKKIQSYGSEVQPHCPEMKNLIFGQARISLETLNNMKQKYLFEVLGASFIFSGCLSFAGFKQSPA